jgi:hypothetical protein
MTRRHILELVHIENHDGLALVRPRTPDATEWLETHTRGTWYMGKLCVRREHLLLLLDDMATDLFN